MASEEKMLKIYDWQEKSGSYLTPMDLYYRFDAVDKEIRDCNDELSDASFGEVSYKDYSDEFNKCAEQCGTINAYIYDLSSTISYLIDHPFYKSLNQDAENLSNIKLENYMTDNLVGVQEEVSYHGGGYSGTYTNDKDKIGFEDFMGMHMNESTSTSGYTGSKRVDCVDEFAKLFEEDYNYYKQTDGFDKTKITSLDDFLEQMYTMGEFDHKLDRPFLNFLSGALDITIIKPIVESCMGKDLITNEQLSPEECLMKFGFAVIDIATLGYGLSVTEFASLSGKTAIKFAGKYVLVSAASDVAGYTTGYIANEMDLPTSVCLIMSMASNAGVSASLSKALFKDGVPFYLNDDFRNKYKAYLKDEFESQAEFRKYMNEVFQDTSLSGEEKTLINIANFNSLTSGQRLDLNTLGNSRYLEKNSDYTSWLVTTSNGSTYVSIPYAWPRDLGLDMTKDVEILSSSNMPKIQERIGSLGGNNFSPLKNESTGEFFSMDEKSILCYIDNTEFARHVYSVDTENYIKVIDCIAVKNTDEATKQLNQLIKDSGLNANKITVDDMRIFQTAYNKFADDARIIYFTEGFDFDRDTVYYGLQGVAAPFRGSTGGAGQINTAIPGWVMKKLGLIEEMK